MRGTGPSSARCWPRQKPYNPRSDESVQGAEAQADAIRIIRPTRAGSCPVEMARLGRAFALFHPLEQIRLDSTVETRPYRWALVGLGMYYALVVLSIGGLVILRRRRVPVLPLVAIGLDVGVSVALTFGQTRYRSTFEIALVLAAAVQLDWVWGRIRGRAGGQTDLTSPRHTAEVGRAEGTGKAVPRRARDRVTGPDLRCAPVPTPSRAPRYPPAASAPGVWQDRCQVQRFGEASR